MNLIRGRTVISWILVFCLLLSACKNLRESKSCGEVSEEPILMFVGKKISIQEVNPDSPHMDAEFLARYLILEKICGTYRADTIEFTVFDHYGRPAFEEYPTVLLYLGQSQGKWYHIKYQFNPLYRTESGQWASPVIPMEFQWGDSSLAKVKPVKINFPDTLSFDISGRKKQWINRFYPEPYYSRQNDRAFPEYGNYIPDLIRLKKSGPISEFFEENGNTDSIVDVDIGLLEFPILTAKDTSSLMDAWSLLVTSAVKGDLKQVRQLSLDSVTCSLCEGFSETYFYNDREPIDSFMASVKRYCPEFEKIISVKRKSIDANRHEIASPHLGDDSSVYSITLEARHLIRKDTVNLFHEFDFVKRNGKFVFKGLSSH